MEKTFLQYDKALLTVMVQARTPQRTKELIDRALSGGAEAFGIQFERFLPEYRNRKTYEDLFSYTDKPVYVTNYRYDMNEGKSDDVLADELLELADCGATLCDVIGDLFDPGPGELAVSPEAVGKQMKLIDSLHKKGAEVLISSHVLQFTPGERVLAIALEHQRRGADISKIVTAATTMEEQLENLKIIHLLKENLQIPFLFLAGGECRIHRRIGGEIGSCMYLCVNEYDDLATPQQPLLSQVKAIRNNM
ncbi:MAG: type I 3-dehydroquinate dehydratase [Clostridia bacterium]|nr:type I 3-dehydroquinate dehydratase [Clostridia bacterium]